MSRRTSDPGTVVVVGASAAGLTVAQGLRTRGHAGRIVLVGAEPHLPYDRPPLSKQVLSGEWPEAQVMLCTAEQLEEAAIETRLGVAATGLSPADRIVTLADGEELAYDTLVIATGVRPRMPEPWRGIDGVLAVRTLDDVRDLRRRVAAASAIAIVGAGFIGAEAAAVLAGGRAAVTMVDPLPYPMAGVLPEAVARLLTAAHADAGTDIRCGVAVTDVTASDGGVTGLRLSDGSSVPADLVIVGLGSLPNVEWLAGSGIPTPDGVACDGHCRAAPGVYAAGDVCSWKRADDGASVRIEHRLHAADQGEYVAATIMDPAAAAPFDPTPFFWTDQLGFRVQVFGSVRPTDLVDVVHGELGAGRFVATLQRDGRVVGVLGVNMPKQTRQAKALIGTEAGAAPAGIHR